MRLRTFALLVFCLAFTCGAFAQGNFVPDINASVKGATPKISIDFHKAGAEAISSYSFGVDQTGSSNTGGGGGSGKANFHDLTFTKPTTASSPGLLLMCASGQHIPAVDITENTIAANGTATPFLRVHLTDVLVSSYQVSSGGDIPTESVSLNFANISFTVTP